MDNEHERLWAVVRKAVELGLLPKEAGTEDYLANVEKIRVLIAAVQAAHTTPPLERGEHRPDSVCSQFQWWAYQAVCDWDGQDNTELLRMLAAKFGISFRDLVMDALFFVQIEDATPANET